MSRVAGPLLVLVLLVVQLASTVTAQEATPSAARAADQPVDLAAMVLLPDDLARLGLPGFGIEESSLRDAPTQAVQHAKRGETGAEERLAVFRDTGFRYRYLLNMLRPQVPIVETSPGAFQASMGIWTSITEFATVDGAARAFPILEDERGNPNAHDVPGAHTIGDQSELTRHGEVTIDQGTPYQALNLTFRLGNLIADVGIDDFTRGEPEVAIAEALAEALRRKMAQVRTGETSGPRLSWRVLRLAADPERIYHEIGLDWYTRLHGVDPPWYGDLAAALEIAGTPTASPATTRVAPAATPVATPNAAIDSPWDPTDIYLYETPLGEGDPEDLPLYRVRLRHFPSVLSSAWDLASRLTTARQPLAAGSRTIERTVREVALGDDGFAVWEGYGEDGMVTKRRSIVYVRVGKETVFIEVSGLPAKMEPPAAIMEALMAAQVACLKRMAWCQPGPVPTELVVAARAATPIAAPPATPTTPPEFESAPTLTPPSRPSVSGTPAGTPIALATPVAAPLVASTCRDVVRSDLAGKRETLLADCITDRPLFVPAGWSFDGGGHTIVAVDPAGGRLTGGVVTLTGASGLVRDVTIDGSRLLVPCLVDRGQTALAGVYFAGASGEVSGVTVRNLQRSLPAPIPDQPGESERESCGTGIAVLGESAQVVIANAVIDDVGYTGILVQHGQASISHNTIARAADTGILALDADVNVGPANWIHDSYVGIQLEGSGTSGEVSGNTLETLRQGGIIVTFGARAEVMENTLTDAGVSGIQVCGGPATVADIHHNRITQNTGLAINVLEGRATVRANQIDGTAEFGIAARHGARTVMAGNTVSGMSTFGIYAATGAAVTLRDSTVVGSGIAGAYAGDKVQLVVERVTFRGGVTGIVADNEATMITVRASTFADHQGEVIMILRGVRADLIGNTITGPGPARQNHYALSGIVMAPQSSGRIRENQVSGFFDANLDEPSCGIEVAETAAVLLESNTFPPPGNEINVCNGASQTALAATLRG